MSVSTVAAAHPWHDVQMAVDGDYPARLTAVVTSCKAAKVSYIFGFSVIPFTR